MNKLIVILIVVWLSAYTAFAQAAELKIPVEILPFIDTEKVAIALESADLNDDKTSDYILVLEDPKETSELIQGRRSLLILTRGTSGKLTLAARNDHDLVYCRTCGGISIGDPFVNIEVGRNTFTVNHYGGSAWRWTDNFKFNYSRLDKTWQLVRAETSSFHATEPEKVKTHVYLPKNFGKINVTDFDPENYLKNKPRVRSGK